MMQRDRQSDNTSTSPHKQLTAQRLSKLP